jgi:hypothetical protein
MVGQTQSNPGLWPRSSWSVKSLVVHDALANAISMRPGRSVASSTPSQIVAKASC